MVNSDCNNCGMSYSAFSVKNNRCEICGVELGIHSNVKPTESKIQSKIGDRVRIIIEEHPWYGEPATVCDIKNKGHTTFIRLCVIDKKVWVPDDWVETI